MAFFKLDPTAPLTTLDLSSLGLRPGHVVNLTVTGDFQASTDPKNVVNFQDIYNNNTIDYAGVSYYKTTGDITLGPNLLVSIANYDTPIGDNGDPDKDFGLTLTILKGPLFTGLNDTVNFRALTSSQAEAVAAGEVLYHAAGGDDVVVLPNRAGYQLTANVAWSSRPYFEAGDGRDFVVGGDGHDRISGGKQNDRLSGGAGNDKLRGGLGVDQLTGGRGKDAFIFDDKETGSSKKTADYITDFRGKLGDRLDLRLIDANTGTRGDQKFLFLGEEDGFTGVGQVRYENTKTATWVYLNTDADTAAEAVIKLKGNIDLPKGWLLL